MCLTCRNSVIGVFVVIFVSSFPLNLKAHHGAVIICNTTNTGINVAVVYRTIVDAFLTNATDILQGNSNAFGYSRGWISEGWYALDSGDCDVVKGSTGDAVEMFFGISEYSKTSGVNSRNVDATVGTKKADKVSRNFCVKHSSPFKHIGSLEAHEQCRQGYSHFLFKSNLWVPAVSASSNNDRTVKLSF